MDIKLNQTLVERFKNCEIAIAYDRKSLELLRAVLYAAGICPIPANVHGIWQFYWSNSGKMLDFSDVKTPSKEVVPIAEFAVRELNQDLIRRLTAGEIAVHYVREVHELEDLSTILKAAFPSDMYKPRGDQRYYYQGDNGEWYAGPRISKYAVPLHEFFISNSTIMTSQDQASIPAATFNPHYIERYKRGEIVISCKKGEGLPQEFDTPGVTGSVAVFDRRLYIKGSIDSIPSKPVYTIESLLYKYPLHKQDAKRIIEAACAVWEKKLKNSWGAKALYEDVLFITDEEYKEMRAACTAEQHKLFDEIFGTDKKYPADGTPCLVKYSSSNDTWVLKYANGQGKFYDRGCKKGAVHAANDYIVLNEEALKNLPVNE